ncbi:MAG TPA: TraR/DksA C4-type zinc finger protein [Acidimicrobiales bacterium]
MTTNAIPTRADTHHLSDDQLAALRGALDEELATQRRQLADLQALVEELTRQPDLDTQMERELAERNLARTAAAIEEIEDALARLDAGTYGICEGCGQPIAPARLEAIPETRTCVNCPAPSDR